MNDANHQPKRCHVCGVDVSDGWFARIRSREEWILLCSPECVTRYFDSLRPSDDARARELAASEHRLSF